MVNYQGKISNVFFMTDSYRPPAKVDKILSGPAVPPTQGSYGHMFPTLVPTKLPNGDIAWKNITSNNVWTANDVPRNGYFAAENGEGVARGQYHFPSFDRWRYAGEGRNTHTFPSVQAVNPNLDSMLIVGFKDGLSKPSFGQTPLNKYTTSVIPINYDINKIGLGFDVAKNAVQDANNYLKSSDGQALLSLLGKKPEEIGYVAYVTEGLPEGVTYAVTRASDGEIILMINNNSFKIISRAAHATGNKSKDLKWAILGEEYAHIGLRHIDDPRDLIEKEIEAKIAVAESYENQERNAASGNPNKARYVRARERSKRLKEFMQEQAANAPEIYSDIVPQRKYSKGNLRLMLAMDAMENGLTGEAAEEYVESRMSQMAEEGREESTRMSSLEQIAEKESREAPNEDVREPATADSSASD